MLWTGARARPSADRFRPRQLRSGLTASVGTPPSRLSTRSSARWRLMTASRPLSRPARGRSWRRSWRLSRSEPEPSEACLRLVFRFRADPTPLGAWPAPLPVGADIVRGKRVGATTALLLARRAGGCEGFVLMPRAWIGPRSMLLTYDLRARTGDATVLPVVRLDRSTIRAELPSVRRQPKKTWPWGQGGGGGQA